MMIFFQAWVAQFIDWMHYSQKAWSLLISLVFFFIYRHFVGLDIFCDDTHASGRLFCHYILPISFFSYLDNKSLLCMQWDMRRRFSWFGSTWFLCVNSCKHPTTYPTWHMRGMWYSPLNSSCVLAHTQSRRCNPCSHQAINTTFSTPYSSSYIAKNP